MHFFTPVLWRFACLIFDRGIRNEISCYFFMRSLKMSFWYTMLQIIYEHIICIKFFVSWPCKIVANSKHSCELQSKSANLFFIYFVIRWWMVNLPTLMWLNCDVAKSDLETSLHGMYYHSEEYNQIFNLYVKAKWCWINLMLRKCRDEEQSKSRPLA